MVMAYLYFLGLSFRNTAKALSFLHMVKKVMFLFGTGSKSTDQRNIVKIKKILEFIINETSIKAGSEIIWLWMLCYMIRKTVRITLHS